MVYNYWFSATLTHCFVFLSLIQCPVRSLQDLTSGLVLCCLAVEYISFSKRFLPELINFLAGTLHLAVQDKTSLGSCSWVIPAFFFFFSLVIFAGFLKVTQIWWYQSLCCRLHRCSTLQAVGEVQRSAAAVGLRVESELEQEEPSTVGHQTARAEKRPRQRSPQVKKQETPQEKYWLYDLYKWYWGGIERLLTQVDCWRRYMHFDL